jgi:hypothetical protein
MQSLRLRRPRATQFARFEQHSARPPVGPSRCARATPTRPSRDQTDEQERVFAGHRARQQRMKSRWGRPESRTLSIEIRSTEWELFVGLFCRVVNFRNDQVGAD